MKNIISSKRDLRTEIDALLGSEATSNIIDTVTEAVAKMDHPRYGDDWTEFFEKIDLWQLAESTAK